MHQDKGKKAYYFTKIQARTCLHLFESIDFKSQEIQLFGDSQNNSQQDQFWLYMLISY